MARMFKTRWFKQIPISEALNISISLGISRKTLYIIQTAPVNKDDLQTNILFLAGPIPKNVVDFV